jgi:hypothetical protein
MDATPNRLLSLVYLNISETVIDINNKALVGA